MAKTSPCPHCNGPLPENLFDGNKVFECEFCSQLVHPAHCNCNECRPPHPASCECDTCMLQVGLAGLRGIKETRRQDELERARLGLPPAEKKGATTISAGPGGVRVGGNIGTIILNGKPQKSCSNCQTLNKVVANFCKQCGNKF